MAGSIFDVEPPRWLQSIAKPIDAKAAGQTIGAVTGGLINAAQSGNPVGESISDSFNEIADPLWQVHKAQANLNLDLAKASLDIKKQFITDQTWDAQNIPEWLRANPTPESKLSSEMPMARTPTGQRAVAMALSTAEKTVDTQRRMETAQKIAADRLAVPQKPQSKVGKILSDRQAIIASGDAAALAEFDKMTTEEAAKAPFPSQEERKLTYIKKLLASDDPRDRAMGEAETRKINYSSLSPSEKTEMTEWTKAKIAAEQGVMQEKSKGNKKKIAEAQSQLDYINSKLDAFKSSIGQGIPTDAGTTNAPLQYKIVERK